MKIIHKEYSAEIHSFIFCIFLFFFSFDSSGQKVGDNYDYKSEVAQLQEQFVTARKNDIHMALALADSTLQVSLEYDYIEGIASGHYKKGTMLFWLGEYEDARENVQKALNFFNQLNDRRGLTDCFNTLGAVYYTSGKHQEALKWYTDALEMAKAIEYNLIIPKILNNIGNIHYDLGHYKEAIDYYDASIDQETNIKEKAQSYANIGLAYLDSNKSQKALEALQKSLDLCLRSTDEYCALFTYGILSDYYFENKEYLKSLFYGNKLLYLADKAGLKDDLFHQYNTSGVSHIMLQNYDSAIFSLSEAIKLGKELGKAELHESYNNLVLAYKTLGQIDSAFKYQELYISAKDSVNSIEKAKQIEDLISKYELTKKENEIILLESNNNLLIIIVVGSIILLVVCFILLIVYKQKNYHQMQLAQKTKEVHEKHSRQMEFEMEIKSIKANLEGQEFEKRRIASDLHDSVAGMIAAIKMRLTKAMSSQKNNNEISILVKEIDKTYDHVRMLSHHLSSPTIMDYPFTDVIKKYIDEVDLNSTLHISLYAHNESMINDLHENLKVEIYRIIQELFNNILKHALATTIEVQLTATEDNINLIVEDNGIGFDANQQYGGIGLNSIRSRIRLLGGTLDIDSVINRGTVVNIRIPLKHKISKTHHEQKNQFVDS